MEREESEKEQINNILLKRLKVFFVCVCRVSNCFVYVGLRVCMWVVSL